MLFQAMARSPLSGLAQFPVPAQMGSKVALQWRLDDSEPVSALHPKIELVREFPLLESR